MGRRSALAGTAAAKVKRRSTASGPPRGRVNLHWLITRFAQSMTPRSTGAIATTSVGRRRPVGLDRPAKQQLVGDDLRRLHLLRARHLHATPRDLDEAIADFLVQHARIDRAMRPGRRGRERGCHARDRLFVGRLRRVFRLDRRRRHGSARRRCAPSRAARDRPSSGPATANPPASTAAMASARRAARRSHPQPRRSCRHRRRGRRLRRSALCWALAGPVINKIANPSPDTRPPKRIALPPRP